jgi:hypothetical protein
VNMLCYYSKTNIFQSIFAERKTITSFYIYMFSLIHFFFLFPSLSRLREEGKTSSLPSSPLPLSFMYTFTYIVVWPEVSLALLNSHKVLSVVPYDLARPESQSPCLGCSTVPIL